MPIIINKQTAFTTLFCTIGCPTLHSLFTVHMLVSLRRCFWFTELQMKYKGSRYYSENGNFPKKHYSWSLKLKKVNVFIIILILSKHFLRKEIVQGDT
jgi:hypothetical protein